MIKHVHLREREIVRASMRLYVQRGVRHANTWQRGTQHLEVGGVRVPANVGEGKHKLQCQNTGLGLVREQPYRRTACRPEGVVRHARDTAHRLTTYKLVRAARFANALMAMIVMAL